MKRRHIERKKGREGTDTGAIDILKGALGGVLFALPLMLALILAVTYIAYSRDDPDSLVSILSFAVLYVTALFAGLLATRRARQNAVLRGALSGAMLVLLLFLLSFFFGDEASSGYGWTMGLFIRASVVGVSSLGGLIGTYKTSNKHRKRRRS